MSDVIKTVGKSGIEVTEYKGEYGLTATYEGKDGKDYQQWGKVRIGKDAYSDKDRPVKVILGDKSTSAAVLVMVLQQITGDLYELTDKPF
jgi:hypothetical protein